MNLMQQMGEFLASKFNAITAAIANLVTSINEVSTKVDNTLESAKGYTDDKSAETLAEAKTYADSAASNIVNGAPETLDTLKEIADMLTEHADALEVITEATGNHTHAEATQSASGFMSASDKVKLDDLGTFEEMVAQYNATLDADSPFVEEVA